MQFCYVFQIYFKNLQLDTILRNVSIYTFNSILKLFQFKASKKTIELLSLSLPSNQSEAKGGCLEILLGILVKIKFCTSVPTMSSWSFEARGLKFGMKIRLINAVKLVSQIFVKELRYLSLSTNSYLGCMTEINLF